jgi:hypothetical protein
MPDTSSVNLPSESLTLIDLETVPRDSDAEGRPSSI